MFSATLQLYCFDGRELFKKRMYFCGFLKLLNYLLYQWDFMCLFRVG